MAKLDRVKYGRIKPKVFFGFMIVLGIALAALWVTYRGFIELTQTQQSLSEPSRKLIKLNSLLTDIYEAESNIRTYTLTQNESYLSIYLSFMVSINEKVDSLLMLAHNDAVQIEKTKFIKELLLRKRRVLNELVELKRTDQTSRFYHMAMEEVEKLELDSLRESAVITSVTTTTTSRRDSIINKALEDSPQSVFGRFLRLFSRKDGEDTTVTKLFVEVETQIDTMKKSLISPSDSLLNEVVKILSMIQERQEMAMYNISEKELELLKSDKEIMDQIRTVVSLLEREELMNSYKLAEEVKEAVSRSTMMLLGLGAIAFIMVVLFTSIIFRDISKANYYRNQLLEAKLYAEKLLKVKEEFLANMNHEIRTPLSAIVGLSRQLQRNEVDSKNRFYIDSLNSSSQHLLQIVNDILDLSKIEGNYIQFESVPFSPIEIAKDALNTFTLKAEEKGLSVELYSSVTSNSLVLGDPFRLKQILYNLISNAIKFTSKGGITLKVDSEENQGLDIKYRFSVSDTGIGIPSDKIDLIFEQFSQIDSSTARLYGGTGLGLTIVKKLTELQGGTVQVLSEVGKGTTFTVEITFPISNESINESPTRRLESLNLPKDIKILVIDDDPISLLLIKEMLKTLGAEPTVLDNAHEALSMIRKTDFTIILTDIQMPGLSGFDFVKSTKELNLKPFPTLIALTANSTADDITFYRNAGFDDVLIKPFDEIQLYNIIAPYVNQSMVDVVKKNSLIQDYDITDIKRFAGDDDESTRIILQSFIDNSESNLNSLTEHINNSNWKGVSEVTHRMKSAFRQLKVYNIANTLEQLENISESEVSKDFLENSLNEIREEVYRVQKLLQRDIERISV